MRLALYSDQTIAANAAMDERVLQLMDARRPRIGYVASTPDPSRFYFEETREYYHRLGAELTRYVDSESDDLATELKAFADCDAIHLSGGNTFVFLHWLRVRGVLPILRSYALENRGVLIGVSAGAILMTPSVETALLCGDLRPAGFNGDEALGLVNFFVWPHFRIGERATTLTGRKRTIYGCADGTGIIVDGKSIELHGAVRVEQR